MITIVAPLATGSPTRVSLLADSLPRTPTPRFDASTPGFGFFTSKVFPRTVWSAAPAREARSAVTVSARPRAERRTCMASSVGRDPTKISHDPRHESTKFRATSFLPARLLDAFRRGWRPRVVVGVEGLLCRPQRLRYVLEIHPHADPGRGTAAHAVD